MQYVPLTPEEIRAILQAIDVSTAFWKACRDVASLQCVVDIFDDALIAQKNLRSFFEKILSESQKEV